MKLLENKNIIVTGACRGIGLAICELFAEHGANLFLNGRDEQALQQLADDLTSRFQNTNLPCCFDVSAYSDVKKGFQSLFKQCKKIDVLVNNAGILDDALIGMVSQQQIAETFSVNTYSVLYCSQYAERLMKRNGGGSIINLASIVGVNGNAGQSVYSASKAAVIGATLSLSKELAAANIRVNAIAPGFIDTDMARSIGDDLYTQRVNSISMKRVGKAKDVANTALFLASDLSDYVTGQVIGVDGGMLI